MPTTERLTAPAWSDWRDAFKAQLASTDLLMREIEVDIDRAVDVLGRHTPLVTWLAGFGWLALLEQDRGRVRAARPDRPTAWISRQRLAAEFVRVSGEAGPHRWIAIEAPLFGEGRAQRVGKGSTPSPFSRLLTIVHPERADADVNDRAGRRERKMSEASTSVGERVEGPLSSIHLVESPRSLRILAWGLASAAAIGLLALIVTPWQQTVLGRGRVVAYAPFDRVQTLAAPLSGRVHKAWVIEGSTVEAGDQILEIVDNDPSILERLEVQRLALESQLSSARERVELYGKQIDAMTDARVMALSGASSLIDVAEASLRSSRQALEGAQAAREQSELDYRRQKELAEEGLVSGFEFEVAQRVYREAQAKTSQAQQSLEAARSTLEARKAEQGQTGTEATARLESARGEREAA